MLESVLVLLVVATVSFGHVVAASADPPDPTWIAGLWDKAMRAAKPGENREQAWQRFIRDWRALQQQSPFFRIWASAGVDEILSALHERVVVGRLP